MSDAGDVDTMYVFMVNFDDTYPLDTVKSLFIEAQAGTFKKYGEPRTVSFHVTSEECSAEEQATLADKWKDGDRYDLAVLVVNAHETRLNITEPCYGYNAVYEALRQCSGDRVVVVLGGDSNQLKPGALRSDWAQRRIGRQFEDEYMEGKNGLLLSWNDKYHKAHVDALRCFALPQYECVSAFPECISNDNKQHHEWKISNLLHDDGPAFRSDVNSREYDSDSDAEPSGNITETTAEISPQPSGKDTGSENLSDIEERDTESGVSSSSHDSEKAKSRKSISSADDENNDADNDSDSSKEKVVVVASATLPLIRSFSTEERGDDKQPNTEEKGLPSDNDTNNSNAVPPSYEESDSKLYPTVDITKEETIPVKESEIPEKHEPVSPSAPPADDLDEPRDEIPAHTQPDTDDNKSADGNLADDDEPREKEDPNEMTCLFTIDDSKPPLPTSDDDDVISVQPSRSEDWSYARSYSKDGGECCLCFGGCWNKANSVTDEDMLR